MDSPTGLDSVDQKTSLKDDFLNSGIEDVKPGNVDLNNLVLESEMDGISKINKWSPGSWQDGTRKSAFLPYRPTTVLTNLQRGNMPTESSLPEETETSLHHRAGQGEITPHDLVPVEVDTVDSNGLSALMWASSYGQVPTIQLLIQHGARVDRTGPEGETSLLLAAANGHHDVVRILLAEGADVNHADDVGNTALMYTAHGDHPHSANELLLRGADITLANHCDDTAFKIAVSRGSHLTQTLIENYLLTLLS